MLNAIPTLHFLCTIWNTSLSLQLSEERDFNFTTFLLYQSQLKYQSFRQ